MTRAAPLAQAVEKTVRDNEWADANTYLRSSDAYEYRCAKEQYLAKEKSDRRRTSLEKGLAKKQLAALDRYIELHGHARVPQTFVVPTEENDLRDDWHLTVVKFPSKLYGVRLGSWVNKQRSMYKAGRMRSHDIALLNQREFVWSIAEWKCERRKESDAAAAAAAAGLDAMPTEEEEEKEEEEEGEGGG